MTPLLLPRAPTTQFVGRFGGLARHFLRYLCGAAGLVAILFAAASLGAFACEQRTAPLPPPLVKSAKFGIFFGGQIEERRDLPFVLDRTKQTQGFTLEFSRPLAADTKVTWQISLPKTAAALRRKPTRGAARPADPEAPRTQSGSGAARAGTARFDHDMPFEPGDPLGVWNVRVVVEDAVVIDRPFEVFDEARRERLTPTDGG